MSHRVSHCCDVADAAQNTTQGIEQLTVTWHVQAVDVRVDEISFVGLRATYTNSYKLSSSSE